MTPLEELPEHLATLKPTDWQRLFDLLPQIESGKAFLQVAPQPNTFPPFYNADITDNVIGVCYELGIVPSFDWTTWREGMTILQRSETDFTALDVITLCKLLTVAIRTDRFSDGFIVGLFHQGVMQKIIGSVQRSLGHPVKPPFH
ncbi:MAG TPA: DUF6508 domain-containing protein [Chitinophagales bacterium]|nr:DUF6508 domain-containing protein [Chitinophagales bacterium]